MKKQTMYTRRGPAVLRIFALLLILSLLAGCGRQSDRKIGDSSDPTEPPSSEQETEFVVDEEETADFLAYCDDLFCEMVISNTINLHYTLADPAAYGIDDYEVTLGSWDPSTSEQDYDDLETALAELQEFDRDTLDYDARITYDILEDYLLTTIASEPYSLYSEPLTTTSGDHTTLPILLAEYNFYSKQDVEDYLLLIEDLPRYFGTIETYERAKADAGLFMSDAMADTVISQCEDFLADPDNNFLLITLQDRLDSLTELTEEEKADYTARIQDAVVNCAFPAYESLIAAITELKETADNPDTDETGVCGLPLGQDYYNYLLKSDVGTDKTAEELMDWLEESLNKKLLNISLLYNEDVEADMNKTLDTVPAPEEMLIDLQEKIREDFPAVDGTSYSVKYVPTALEESTSPAFYLTPPMDRSDENVIYINQKYYDPTDIYYTLAHEGYPGHLLQTVYFNRSCTIPLRQMLSTSGYVEGWATYVEMQSYEWAELYESATARVLAANQEATLYLYGMMDLGINYEGWTREDTAQFLTDYFAIDDDEVVNEIFETMIGEPANYLNYIVGCLEWQELREEQEDAKGKNFTALTFHEQALRIGPCPFYILREYLR